MKNVVLNMGSTSDKPRSFVHLIALFEYVAFAIMEARTETLFLPPALQLTKDVCVPFKLYVASACHFFGVSVSFTWENAEIGSIKIKKVAFFMF